MTMNQTNPNPDPAVINPAENSTPTPTRTNRKKPDLDFSLSYTPGPKLPEFKNHIPAVLAAHFPEFDKLSTRLLTFGLNRVKFFFSYAPNSEKPNRRVTQQFYITRTNPKKTVNPPTGLYAAGNHKITGKTYFRLFPEIRTLFTRLEKRGATNFILNISFHHIEKPSTRREHIIKFNAPNSWTD